MSSTVAVAACPTWVLQHARRRGRQAAPLADVICEGEGRNTFLTSLAGTMRRRGATPDEIAEALAPFNRHRCQPPLDDDEVRGIAQSVGRYPPADPAAQGAQDSPAASRSGRPTQADALVALAVDVPGVELFHARDGETGYAIVPVDAHRETWAIRSAGFTRWLRRRYYQATGKAPSAQPVEDALRVLEARAHFDGPVREVFVRVAHVGDAVYLDLADDRWRVVEITAAGSRLLDTSPVAFRRARGMLTLPEPRSGGSLDELREFVNVGSDDDWRLVAGWLVGALHPTGPYPVLPLHAEQGAGKTTTAKVLRTLIDPNTALVRAEPREARDLMIAAMNGWVVAFDNISRLPVWLSDALCRLATGGGFATRALYTDADEMIFDAKRPVLLNGIEDIVTRSDLLDRALVVYMPQIPDEQRRQEREFWSAFREAHPRLLGAVLDAVAYALRRQDAVHLDRPPRMADFATWVTAAEPALGWPPGSFVAAYTKNRAAGAELELEASPVAIALRTLVEQRLSPWEGTATRLLEALAQHAGEATRSKTWPGSPQALGGVLRRLAPNLRATGIVIESRHVGRDRRKIFTVERRPPDCDPHDPPAPPAGGALPADRADQADQEFPGPSGSEADTLMPLADALGDEYVAWAAQADEPHIADEDEP